MNGGHGTTLLASPWPVLHIPVGTVNLGACSDTFYVWIKG